MLAGSITLAFSPRLASAVVTASGELDLSGYGFLRDGLLKVAADGPPALIADIDGLIIGELSPIAVFPLVARRMANWPGIPLALVTRQGIHWQAFRGQGFDRFVAVHDNVELAESQQRSPLAEGPIGNSLDPRTRRSWPARSFATRRRTGVCRSCSTTRS